jgi:crotonobetainyl-CoA:carnitine CoA-transferase CaiB-like acyl-CoA transferase
MGMPEIAADPRFDTLNHRRENREALVRLIEDWLKTFDDIDVPAKMLADAGIPSTKVFNSKDLIADEHVKAEKYIVDVPVPDNVTSRKTFFARNCAAKFSETPGEVRKAPYVGQNNYEILERFGLTRDQIDAMESRWI